jgi:hypothetical protein
MGFSTTIPRTWCSGCTGLEVFNSISKFSIGSAADVTAAPNCSLFLPEWLPARQKFCQLTSVCMCCCARGLQLFTVLCRLPPSFAVFHDATKSCMLLEELCRQPQRVSRRPGVTVRDIPAHSISASVYYGIVVLSLPQNVHGNRC